MLVCVFHLHHVALVFAAPLDGPIVTVKDKPGHDEAELVWKEIPAHRRRGFITNYTIFYSGGSNLYSTYPTLASRTYACPRGARLIVVCFILAVCRHHRSSQHHLVHSEVPVREHQVRHVDRGVNHQWVDQGIQPLLHHPEVW